VHNKVIMKASGLAHLKIWIIILCVNISLENNKMIALLNGMNNGLNNEKHCFY